MASFIGGWDVSMVALFLGFFFAVVWIYSLVLHLYVEAHFILVAPGH